MRIARVPANPTLLDNNVLNDVCLGPTLAGDGKIVGINYLTQGESHLKLSGNNRNYSDQGRNGNPVSKGGFASCQLRRLGLGSF